MLLTAREGVPELYWSFAGAGKRTQGLAMAVVPRVCWTLRRVLPSATPLAREADNRRACTYMCTHLDALG